MLNTAKQTTLPLFGDDLRRTTRTLAAWMLFTATDLFCGAGGTTTGFENAMFNGQKVVSTTQVVNHDALAIASHAANHAAARHFTEDITKLDASLLVRTALLWASLECTNFSNAKGGQSRDADSRSLAEHMERYIRAVNPLYFFVENVREFMSWGPLYHKKDQNGKLLYRRAKLMEQKTYRGSGKPMFSRKTGKPLMRQVVNGQGELQWEQKPVMVPVSRTKGRDFIRWKQSIEDLGYTCSYKLLNAADYGERTSRVRLFMIFAKKGLPVRWPSATHSKAGKTLNTAPWLPVRPCLRLEQKGRSIFNRTKTNKHGQVLPDPLVKKTLKRIYAGLCKYIAGRNVKDVTALLQGIAVGADGSTKVPKAVADAWLMKRTSNPPSGKANPGASIDQSAPTLACGFQPDLIQPEFLAKTFTGNPEHLIQSTDQPAGAVTTVDHHQLIQSEFIVPQFTASAPTSATEPVGTVTTTPRARLVQPEFLTMRHNTDVEHRQKDLDQPANTITTKDHHALVQAEFLTNPGWVGGNTGAAEPSNTIVARQDKVPLSLVQPEFITQYNGGSDECRNLSLEGPANTITTENRFGLVQADFVSKYYGSGDNVTSLEDPAGTITTKDRMALVQTQAWLDKRYGSGDHNHQPLDTPAGTITTNDHHAVVQPEWLDKNYGSGEHNHQPLTVPAGTILTTEKLGLVQTEFLDQQYGASLPTSAEQPAGSLTGIPKLNLVQTEFLTQSFGGPDASKVTGADEPGRTVLATPNQSLVQAEPWIMPTSFDNVGRSLDEPAPTILASRQHHYLVQPDQWLLDNKFDNEGRALDAPGPTLLTGNHYYLISPDAIGGEPVHWQEQADDCETMLLIRRFMRLYGLSDVLMRMLLVEELLSIQGFPSNYVLLGSSTEQKKFIGNSVPPKMSQRIVEAIYGAMSDANLLDLLRQYEGSYSQAA